MITSRYGESMAEIALGTVTNSAAVITVTEDRIRWSDQGPGYGGGQGLVY